MRPAILLPALLVSWALAAGCGRSRSGTARAVKAPAPVGVPVLRFRPPENGLVTDGQLDLYVRVRRAARGRSDREAARAVGVDPDEFVWVRARIVEALVALDVARVRGAAEGTYTRTLAALRESRRSARDRETARTLDEQIAGLERERASLKKEDPAPPAVAANARRVATRRAEIESVSR